MYCRNCGRPIAPGCGVCPNCGCPIDSFGASEEKSCTGAEEKSCTGLAIVALIFAFLIRLLGLILGILALNKAKRYSDTTAKNTAVASIVISSIGLIVEILLLVVVGAAVGA